MKTILVTGGAGFIGSNLVKRLLEEDNQIIALDNLITGNERNIEQFKSNPRFHFIKHDIVKQWSNETMKQLNNVSLIFHLACPTGVPDLIRLGHEMLLTSSVGTENILILALKNNARVLFTSSSEVYGDPLESPQKESYTGNASPVGPRSTYEEGKRFAEALVSFYVRKHNLDARIVRVFNTYGPNMKEDDSRVIPRFLKQALSKKPLTIQGDGKQTRTFCYVDDLVNGLLLVMDKGKKGEVYNLGGDEQISMKELAELIKKVTRYTLHVTRIPRPDHDHNSRQPDLAKIKKLGWKQEISLKEGLMKTIEYYKPIKY